MITWWTVYAIAFIGLVVVVVVSYAFVHASGYNKGWFERVNYQARSQKYKRSGLWVALINKKEGVKK